MSKLVIVSNRLPVTVERHKGEILVTPSVGGLATGLGSFYRSRQSVWIGWPGIASGTFNSQGKARIIQQLNKENCYPIFLSRKQLNGYYNGFCNKTIWPLFHYFPLYTQYTKYFWKAYKEVNQVFCDAVVDVASPEDTIWVQDYQLLLLPGLIRKRLPEAKIGFFLHIPFPSSEVFRLLPWRKELLENLLGADLIGFHTYDYVRHFLTSVRRLLGNSQVAPGKLLISLGNRMVKVDAFPMGIDYEHFTKAVDAPETQQEARRIRSEIGDRKIILSVDRLDYTKGLIQRLEAYNLFLEEFPEYKGKVTLVLKAIASRAGISQYQLLKKRLDELVGRVNGKHGTLEWMPIWYLYHFLPESVLIALYYLADVALLTPVRDGMNLTAKEFLATKVHGDGVLILSEMAGAAQELPEALIVNPNNQEEMARAIKAALAMPQDEQRKRTRMMQARLQRYNVVHWAQDFIKSISSIKSTQAQLAAKKLSPEMRDTLVKSYRTKKPRLLLLDHDGTLVPFFAKPEEARPSKELLLILETLAEPSENTVVIMSGRDKEILNGWFGHLGVGLVAEHGVWIKEPDQPWQMTEALTIDWKDEVRSLLELYVDRTPGSVLEEKEFSLVWHYRSADEAFAEVRVGELKEDLAPLLANRPLGVLEGKKLLEVKNAGINKGRVALEWLSKESWEFILAVGDDATDEDTFHVLPETAFSMRVGLGASQARFNIDSPEEVRSLLKALTRVGSRKN